MPGFSITPVAAFPPASDNGFPRFIQFQHEGVDVGSTAVETLNFTGAGVTAMTVNSAGSAVTVDIEGGGTPAAAFTWDEFAADYTLALADANNGLASIGNSGVQVLSVPENASVAFTAGDAIVVMQDGGAPVQIVALGVVELVYRSAAFNAVTAGEGAAITLIYRGSNRWLLCGDLESV